MPSPRGGRIKAWPRDEPCARGWCRGLFAEHAAPQLDEIIVTWAHHCRALRGGDPLSSFHRRDRNAVGLAWAACGSTVRRETAALLKVVYRARSWTVLLVWVPTVCRNVSIVAGMRG